MNNKIYSKSKKIVGNYLDLVSDFPEVVDITTDEHIGVFINEIEESELNNQQTKYKKRKEIVEKRQDDFFKEYTYDEVVLLFNAYEYGKELRTNNKVDLDGFYESIQREVSDLKKDEIIYEIIGKQDWIVKESLQHYLKNFA